MKKILAACACFVLVATVKAQDGPKNVVKINPLGIFFGSASVAYERALSEKSSVVIAPSFGYIKSGGSKYTTFGLAAEYRFYLSQSKSAPTGWYVGPGASFASGTAKMTDSFNGTNEKVSVSGFSVKGIVGHQWIFNGGFALDLNAGIQYFSLKVKDNSEGIGSFNGILPALGIAVGYGF